MIMFEPKEKVTLRIQWTEQVTPLNNNEDLPQSKIPKIYLKRGVELFVKRLVQ